LFQIVLEELRSNGNLEWVDPKLKRRCHIYWRSPEEWGTLIYAWANENRYTDQSIILGKDALWIISKKYLFRY
jgi:hypothetical protein